MVLGVADAAFFAGRARETCSNMSLSDIRQHMQHLSSRETRSLEALAEAYVSDKLFITPAHTILSMITLIMGFTFYSG